MSATKKSQTFKQSGKVTSVALNLPDFVSVGEIMNSDWKVNFRARFQNYRWARKSK